jgi:FMN reductase
MTRIVVVTAGLSRPSSTRLLADRIADAVGDRLRVRDADPEVETIELRELGSDIMSAMLTGGMPSARLSAAAESLASADAVIAVTPVFTASYSGLFKSFFDVLDPGVLQSTPVLIAATAGTERHSLVLDHALRPLFTYLRAVVVPTGVFAATSDFGGQDEAGEGLSRRIARAADELSDLVAARPGTPSWGTTRSARPTDALAQAEAAEDEGSFTPFEELLGHQT